jgi:hypothetical protein
MPRTRIRLVILTLSILFSALVPPSVWAWEFTASGQVEGLDRAEALVFDVHDNVIAAGTLENDVFAVKLHRRHGHALWTFRLPHPGGVSERASSVALDPTGHVVLAGMTAPEGGGTFTVIKLDKETGLPQWINFVGQGDARAVAVDGAGDVIAAGLLEGGMGVVKLRGADGVQVWRAQPNAGRFGRAHALALDGAGNAVVAGFLTQPDFVDAFAVVELAGSDGTERWQHLISGFGEAVGVALDRAGDVLAVGVVFVQPPEGGPRRREFTVVKLLGAEGTLRWRRDVSANGSGGDPRAIVVDAGDDVVVTGAVFDAVGSHNDVVKLAGFDGSEQWRARDEAVSPDSVDVNASSDVVVAGRRFGPQRFDIVARKLSGATGAESWRTVRDGAGHGDDIAVAARFDSGGNVAVVGELVGATTNADFVVIKLKGDGEDF